MNKVTKGCVLVASLLTMALSPLAQVSAAPFQGMAQNTTYGHEVKTSSNAVEQVRHNGRPHYNNRHRHRYYDNNRHRHYKKQRRHRSNRYCHYSPRRGTMVCKPRHRHSW